MVQQFNNCCTILEVGGAIVLVKYSQSFKRYPFNLIFGQDSSSEQLTKEKIYLVLEMLLDLKECKVSYRFVNNLGIPSIYDADAFKVVSGSLDGYYLVQNRDDYITITHKLIFEARLNEFWEVYFDNPTNKEKTLLENVIKDLSFREGIPAPMLEHNECF